MFLASISTIFTLETSEMYAIFVFTTKATQPRPQVFSVIDASTWGTFDVIGSLIAKFFQIRSSVAGSA